MEMAHLQYMPGDPRLVDQLVYELKSKGIFDQFRKECIADVDTRPAYQNLRQRVESSVSTFLARQCWQPDLNKNQLREKLRKHILDGNYLEQGVERIVDQVVNPKVASVFIPQVEDLVYNFLGISRKKAAPVTEASNEKPTTDDLLPTDLEAVSPGSVKSTDEKNDDMDTDMQVETKMDVEEEKHIKEDSVTTDDKMKIDEPMAFSEPILTPEPDLDIDKKDIPLPSEDIKLENIPAPENSPPKAENDKIELHKIELPKEPNVAREIATPEKIPLPLDRKESYKSLNLQSDDESSSDSSLRRNMSPLTPIRNYNNENSCDAQQAFENDFDGKGDEKKEPSSFRFTIDAKSTENSLDGKPEKTDEQENLSYEFNNQVNITFNTPMSDDSSNSHNLHIDYESDASSKMIEKVPEIEQNSEDSKKDKKPEDKKSSYKTSHRSRDSHRHSSSKDKRSDSKQSTSRDSSRHDRKSKEDHSSSKSKTSHRDKSRDTSEKKDSRDSSRHRTSHKSSSHKDSKSHRSSSSSQKSVTKNDDKKSSTSSHRDKNDKNSDKSSKDKEKDKDKRDSKSSSTRSEKDRKGSSSSSKSKTDDKDKKKDKKDNDDHYSLSGRGNPSRRSTDRDSNDGSSSSKGSHNPTNSKSAEAKKETKDSNSKSDNTSTSGDSTSPSDKDQVMDNVQGTKNNLQPVRVENHLETPIASPPRLPFVPDVTLKKPKFAANLKEAKQMMKMRKFLDDEQKRMNQEAALLLEFQANVRPNLSQVFSSIPGPELEFACGSSETAHDMIIDSVTPDTNPIQNITPGNDVQDIEIKKQKSIESDVDNAHADLEKNTDSSEHSTEPINDKGDKGTYSENKPFSKLMEEITQYSKASERNKHSDGQTLQVEEVVDENDAKQPDEAVITDDVTENETDDTKDTQNDVEKENFENVENASCSDSKEEDNLQAEVSNITENTYSETPVPITEENIATPSISQNTEHLDELHYFAEHEKYDAEIKRHQYTNFLKAYIEKNLISSKIYLFNCDSYEENLIKEASESYGRYEIVNYYRNGHLKLPKNVIKNVNLVTEITLPVDNYDKSPSRVDNYESRSPLFSPVKSECSFELSSDYDAKLEEMVNKTSRQEVMEIILGSVIDESDNPRIDYCTESSIDSDINTLKRKLEVETTMNNNRQVLVPKMRRLSESNQISSTTEEMERKNRKTSLSTPNNTRSKYLGRAKRVGLSRPKRNLPNSPSSDQSVENYSQNPAPASAPASASASDKQRYHPSDLYKPKLHYLCRRNNVT